MVIKTNQSVVYKAKVTICSDILTKHSTQSERRVEFSNVKPCGTERPLSIKGLSFVIELVPPKSHVLFNSTASYSVALMVNEIDLSMECWCHILTEKT